MLVLRGDRRDTKRRERGPRRSGHAPPAASRDHSPQLRLAKRRQAREGAEGEGDAGRAIVRESETKRVSVTRLSRGERRWTNRTIWRGPTRDFDHLRAIHDSMRLSRFERSRSVRALFSMIISTCSVSARPRACLRGPGDGREGSPSAPLSQTCTLSGHA